MAPTTRCPICFDPPTAPLAAPCSHVFCYSCAMQLLQTTDRCPVCACRLVDLPTASSSSSSSMNSAAVASLQGPNVVVAPTVRVTRTTPIQTPTDPRLHHVNTILGSVTDTTPAAAIASASAGVSGTPALSPLPGGVDTAAPQAVPGSDALRILESNLQDTTDLRELNRMMDAVKRRRGALLMLRKLHELDVMKYFLAKYFSQCRGEFFRICSALRGVVDDYVETNRNFEAIQSRHKVLAISTTTTTLSPAIGSSSSSSTSQSPAMNNNIDVKDATLQISTPTGVGANVSTIKNNTNQSIITTPIDSSSIRESSSTTTLKTSSKKQNTRQQSSSQSDKVLHTPSKRGHISSPTRVMESNIAGNLRRSSRKRARVESIDNITTSGDTTTNTTAVRDSSATGGADNKDMKPIVGGNNTEGSIKSNQDNSKITNTAQLFEEADSLLDHLMRIYRIDTLDVPGVGNGADSSVPQDDSVAIKEATPTEYARIDLHMDDLSVNYERHKRLKSLPEFSSSLEHLCRHKSIRVLADISYSDSSTSGSNAIVSSIDFDKDDEFFATAGVMKKIRIYSYSSVVNKYSLDDLDDEGKTTSGNGGNGDETDIGNLWQEDGDLDTEFGKSFHRLHESTSGGVSSSGTHRRNGGTRNDSTSGNGGNGGVRVVGSTNVGQSSGSGHYSSRNLRSMGNRSRAILGEESMPTEEDGLGSVVRYPLLSLNCSSKLSCVAFNSYIKQQLLSSNYEGKLHIYNVATGQTESEFKEHDKRAWSVAWSIQDPLRFASGGDDTKVKIWSRLQARSACTIESRANVCSVIFSPTKAHEVAFGSADHNVHIYDLRNPNRPLMVLKGHSKAVSYVRYIGADMLVSASTDCTLRAWALVDGSEHEAGACTRVYSGHMNEKNFVGMDVDPSGRYLACGSEDNKMFVYYRDTSQPLFQDPFVRSGTTGKATDPPMFVSSVCWARRIPNMFLAANSGGHVRLMEMD